MNQQSSVPHTPSFTFKQLMQGHKRLEGMYPCYSTVLCKITAYELNGKLYRVYEDKTQTFIHWHNAVNALGCPLATDCHTLAQVMYTLWLYARDTAQSRGELVAMFAPEPVPSNCFEMLECQDCCPDGVVTREGWCDRHTG